MKKRLLLSLALSISIISCFAQLETNWKDRIVLGGNFGAGFSNIESMVAISPTIGYRFTERFTAGPGFIYQYYSYKPLALSFNNYGAKVFASYLLTPNILAYSEYEALNLQTIYLDPFGAFAGKQRRTIGSLLVGGGYRQEFGSSSSIDLMLLYNLTETPYTPYSNPIIRLGLGFGIR